MPTAPRHAILLLLLLAVGCRPAARGGEAPRYVPVGGGAPLPFSAAVRVGPLLYLSGQIGTDSAGHLVPGGIAAETRQALENIRSVLEHNESSLDRVVKCTAMLADIHDWGAMNQVYVTYFRRHLPARSAFATSGLVFGARIELECMASVGAGS
ncbi:MAG: RidA family protein [Gemmatimonadales bacterium]